MEFESTRSQYSFIDHVLSIGHANHEDVVERVDAVYFGQELIDDGVGDARAVSDASSTLTDRVLCGNQMSGAPRHRRDAVPVADGRLSH